MKVSGLLNGSFPALAWCALMRKASPDIKVMHGDGVIVSDDYFFEGAWAGSYSARDFTGGRVPRSLFGQEKRVALVTPDEQQDLRPR